MTSEQRMNHEVALDAILANYRQLDITEDVEYDTPKWPVACGAFGEIYNRRYTRSDGSDTVVAIKCLTVYADGKRDTAKIFKREINAWNLLQHANVLPLLSYVLENNDDGSLKVPSLVSEWMDNGCIPDYTRKQSLPSGLFGLVCFRLKHLHEKNVAHADFKSANVLVSRAGRAVICDFGAVHVSCGSESSHPSSNASDPRGTSRWLAYELLVPGGKNMKVTKAFDTWAFGMTLYEILTNDYPYAGTLLGAQVLISIMNFNLPEPTVSEATTGIFGISA
ncbi:hypothetical protein ACEPAI_2159 [Sanghuangporus weigelae]